MRFIMSGKEECDYCDCVHLQEKSDLDISDFSLELQTHSMCNGHLLSVTC